MAYLFLDESKHHRSGFSLAAFAITDANPAEGMGIFLRKHFFDPRTFEIEPFGRRQDDKSLQIKLFDWKRRCSA